MENNNEDKKQQNPQQNPQTQTPETTGQTANLTEGRFAIPGFGDRRADLALLAGTAAPMLRPVHKKKSSSAIDPAGRSKGSGGSFSDDEPYYSRNAFSDDDDEIRIRPRSDNSSGGFI